MCLGLPSELKLLLIERVQAPLDDPGLEDLVLVREKIEHHVGV